MSDPTLKDFRFSHGLNAIASATPIEWKGDRPYFQREISALVNLG
ncbi:MAG: hypothetical protein AAFX40_04215 [Cyanobacteria bacterium J06639_1]